MFEVEVEISWTDSAGKTQKQELSSVFTRRQYNQFPEGRP
jgi:hypothetical protein